MPYLSKLNSGIIFALVTACGLGAITTLAKIFYADGGNALTLMLTRLVVSTLVFGLLILIMLAYLILNETLSIVQASSVILVLSIIIFSLRFQPTTT